MKTLAAALFCFGLRVLRSIILGVFADISERDGFLEPFSIFLTDYGNKMFQFRVKALITFSGHFIGL